MSELLFDKVRERLQTNLHTHTMHFVPNLVGGEVENHSFEIANQNYEAFKALCDILEEEIDRMDKIHKHLFEHVEQLQNTVVHLKETLFEKGFLTKDEMIIK